MCAIDGAYQVELVFNNRQTLNDILLELLLEKTCTFDFETPPVKNK
ncbi:MAG: hypothetical protein PHR18_05465 [Oscillospiraceae bacterium]|nr:hypothetical protein [Oscillospiraceae bacterium]